MFLIEKMETYHFSASEKVIVDYLLTEKYNMEDKTSASIAKATFFSKSTLVRIAKKLGYKGWTDLKKAFLEEVTYLDRSGGSVDANIPFKKDDHYLKIAHNLAQLKQETIDETLSLLTAKQLNQALSILKPARTIHVFAASNNLLNAQEFAHNLSRIQKDIRIHQLQGETLFNAFLAQADSCALIISYSSGTESLIKACQLLKRHQIPIIAITSLGENPINQLADMSLRLATKEKLYSKIGTFATDASIAYLLDLLYACLFVQDYDHNLELRRFASQQIESERFAQSKVLNEE